MPDDDNRLDAQKSSIEQLIDIQNQFSEIAKDNVKLITRNNIAIKTEMEKELNKEGFTFKLYCSKEEHSFYVGIDNYNGSRIADVDRCGCTTYYGSIQNKIVYCAQEILNKNKSKREKR